MRIVIDLQAAQGWSRDRDSGRASLALALALAHERGDHEILVALAGMYPETIEPIRAAFEGLLPQEHLRVWHAPGPVAHAVPGNDWRRRTAELTREAFLASLEPDFVIVCSLFEGLSDDMVVSIGMLSDALPTGVVLHGPVSPERRDPRPGENPTLDVWHENKLDHLRRADLIFALSAPTYQDAVQYLGLAPDAVVELGTAPTSARRMIEGIEAWRARRAELAAPELPARLRGRRPRLAYVSPLPPERSGISDYSAELLPELARHYEIEVVVSQFAMTDPWVLANAPVRDTQWLHRHAGRYDRVLYHFGNSAFHRHMFALLEDVPGIVVLHDFFLSNIVAQMEDTGYAPGCWTKALYEGHGWHAVQERFAARPEDVIWKYPVNLGVLRQALGVITHSQVARRMAADWYDGFDDQAWAVVPLLRTPAAAGCREAARQALNLPGDAYVVCSFGLLGPHKLNDRLIEAWIASRLARDPQCLLVFVGENHGGEYGRALTRRIHASGLSDRIRITGWADAAVFRQWLQAADAGVQLRTQSRGETSAAVLDCMNHGLPTVINANGSMAEIADDAVWKLPDEFTDAQLIEALETWRADPVRRRACAEAARKVIRTNHAPRACADQYAQFIENTYEARRTGVDALIRAAAGVEPAPQAPAAWAPLASDVALSIMPRHPVRRLFVDVSALVREDLRTGIQRVVRSVLQHWLAAPPPGHAVEPVYGSIEEGYRYARAYTQQFLGCPQTFLQDEPVEFAPGDIFLGLDLHQHVVFAQQAFYQHLRRQGVRVLFVVYDLLPLALPQAFPEGTTDLHRKWAEVVAESDGIIAISRAVADEFARWQATAPAPKKRRRGFRIGWFHLGADLDASKPTTGIPDDGPALLAAIAERPTFLMVGTIEPRKGHLQTIRAFTDLWERGADVNLVIVGGEGWKGLPDAQRRTIPQIMETLASHPRRGDTLHWVDRASDEFLAQIYAASTCLIAASEGEGFGLPLIEAAQHGVPIIARDIPVFREVAGGHAHYFSGGAPEDLTRAVSDWLDLHARKAEPQSAGMPWLTWAQSAAQLWQQVLNSDHTTTQPERERAAATMDGGL